MKPQYYLTSVLFNIIYECYLTSKVFNLNIIQLYYRYYQLPITLIPYKQASMLVAWQARKLLVIGPMAQQLFVALATAPAFVALGPLVVFL